MAFEEFVIQPLEMHEAVIHPAFSDLLPSGSSAYDGFLTEFTLMDNVPNKRPIVDVRKKMKILQRRDASCDLVYKKIMGTSVRQIEVADLYGATQHCKHEFYQGALRDWEGEDPLFGNKIMPYFQDAMRVDMAANAWFGDVNRIDSSSLAFSICEYDGVIKWIKHYYTLGLIPASQSIAMPVVDFRANPAQAFQIIEALYDKQEPLMRAMPDSAKAIYCTAPVLEGYKKYLRALGTTIEYISLYANGISVATYNGIPLVAIPIFEPIMNDIYGAPNHNIAILTIRKNFVFATDKSYGEGEDGHQALMVWYEKRKLSWFYQMFLKGGTNIAEPEMICFAIPNA